MQHIRVLHEEATLKQPHKAVSLNTLERARIKGESESYFKIVLKSKLLQNRYLIKMVLQQPLDASQLATILCN